MTTDVDPEQRSRLGSCDTNYYPTISELLESSDQDVQKFLAKTKKDTLVCILREAIAQLRNKSLCLIANDIAEIKVTLEKAVSEQTLSSPQPMTDLDNESSIAPTVKISTNSLKSSDIPYRNKIRVSCVPEQNSDLKKFERSMADKVKVEQILENLGEPVEIRDVYRKGAFRTDRKRTIIVELSNPWDVRKVVGAATKNKFFKQSGFLVTYDLSPKDQEIEQKLLAKRFEFLKSGTDKKRLKIRGLKLYKDDVEVKLE